LQKNGGKKLTYSFFNSQTNSSLITEGLVAGTYSYVATSQINGKTETDKGEFIVKANELESQELEANHGMLEDIAKANNGTSVGIGSIKSLIPNGDEKPKLVSPESKRLKYLSLILFSTPMAKLLTINDWPAFAFVI